MVGHLGDGQRQGHRAGGPRHGHRIAVGGAQPGGGLRGEPDDGAAGGAGQLGLVALERAGVEQLPPGGQQRLVRAQRRCPDRGDVLTVTGAAGAVTLPVRLTEMPDRVVWLPMRSPGSEVRAQLGAGPGSVVRLSAGGVR